MITGRAATLTKKSKPKIKIEINTLLSPGLSTDWMILTIGCLTCRDPVCTVSEWKSLLPRAGWLVY